MESVTDGSPDPLEFPFSVLDKNKKRVIDRFTATVLRMDVSFLCTHKLGSTNTSSRVGKVTFFISLIFGG